ncbi:MAG TPA: flavodoxin domain-containing protein [Polyangiaceae bacterium]|nr:flavodoxin domain-containing protein [Polyangiaceae bacterium]
MSNVIVVYASREGQTEKIARRIASVVQQHGHAVALFDAEHPTPGIDLARFDVAFVGAPIHAGGYPRSVARFVRSHRSSLPRIPAAFFSVGLAVASRTSDGRAQTMPLVESFLRKTQWRPRRVELVAGALPYSKYNPFIRFIMKRIAAKEGGDTDTTHDHEYTDWGAVDRFALDFVASAGAADVAPVASHP